MRRIIQISSSNLQKSKSTFSNSSYVSIHLIPPLLIEISCHLIFKQQQQQHDHQFLSSTQHQKQKKINKNDDQEIDFDSFPLCHLSYQDCELILQMSLEWMEFINKGDLS